MRLQLRSRFAVLLWAAALLAALTVACAPDVEPPPEGARLVESGPADPAAKPPPAPREAAGSPAPATPAPAVQAQAASSPVARMASPAPASNAPARWATTEATFLVSNTLGRGMALRSSPVSRDPGKMWPDGTRMKGLGAEQDAYGWTWRWVRDPDGNTGWMPSNYLVMDDSVPAQASNGILQSPSAPPTLILVPTRGVPEATPTAGPPTPTGSPVPAPQSTSAPQNALLPQTDGMSDTLRNVTSSAGNALPSGLPAMFGGR